jgi:ActR/RegA family two-component response regulator
MVPTLIVDPNRARHDLYRDMLGRSFALSFAESCEAAITHLSTKRALIMIACADLPDGSGIALCPAVRKTPGGSNMKILLAGEDLNDAILGRDTARQMGADDLIKLPYEASHLKVKLKTFLLELKSERDAGATPEPGSAPVVAEAAPVAPSPSPVKSDVSAAVFRVERLPDAELLAAFPGLTLAQVEELDAERLSLIATFDRQLEQLDYYALLGISRDANPGLMRKAYYAMSRNLHPDRFTMAPLPSLIEAVGRVFKRQAEAYSILKDPDLRREYDQTLSAGDSVRLKQTERKSEGPRDAAIGIANPQARKFFSMAANAQAIGDYKSAQMNLKLALSLAPGDEQIMARLAELQKLMT